MLDEIGRATCGRVWWITGAWPSRQVALDKLREEIGELLAPGANVQDEAADVVISLASLAAVHMFSLDDAVRRKVAINEARTWEWAENGTIRHVERT